MIKIHFDARPFFNQLINKGRLGMFTIGRELGGSNRTLCSKVMEHGRPTWARSHLGVFRSFLHRTCNVCRFRPYEYSIGLNCCIQFVDVAYDSVFWEIDD